jgi:hypothetical protein
MVSWEILLYICCANFYGGYLLREKCSCYRRHVIQIAKLTYYLIKVKCSMIVKRVIINPWLGLKPVSKAWSYKVASWSR